VTRCEDQAKQIVAHRIIDRRVEIRHRRPLRFQLAAELLVLAALHRVAAQQVDRAALADRHQPGARIVRDARLRPLLERSHQRVLRKILRHAHVAYDPGQSRNQASRLDPPYRVDRAMRIRYTHGCAPGQRAVGRR